jgi:predicted TPR repeat methyltransferase
MLAKARDRDIYDELAVGELTEWLGNTRQFFDLIVACDTFIYFGDLRQVVGPATKRLNPGGAIAFSVEQAKKPPFRLTVSGRYEHHFQHIRYAAEAFRMQIASHREAFLRMEYGPTNARAFPHRITQKPKGTLHTIHFAGWTPKC